MQKAYALLGVAFIIVFGSAYVLFERAYAPTTDDESIVHSEAESMTLTLTSPEFTHNTSIPSRYTCDGENILPPLVIEGVPEGTGSLVLVMDDPDVPDEIKAARGITKFDHVAIYNIPVDTELIDADAMPGTGALNGRGETGYVGPCPPSEYEPTEHRYIFRLYAIEGTLNFIKAPTLDELEAAAKGRAIESAELIGRYERI